MEIDHIELTKLIIYFDANGTVNNSTWLKSLNVFLGKPLKDNNIHLLDILRYIKNPNGMERELDSLDICSSRDNRLTLRLFMPELGNVVPTDRSSLSFRLLLHIYSFWRVCCLWNIWSICSVGYRNKVSGILATPLIAVFLSGWLGNLRYIPTTVNYRLLPRCGHFMYPFTCWNTPDIFIRRKALKS